ncbi:MAG: hypothetical protein WEF50_10725 [Myxococcota bacterium]
MKKQNPISQVSHLLIAELVTCFVLRRLDGDRSVDPERFGELICKLIAGVPR